MKRSWSQELVATAELVGVEIRHMSNPIHMVRAIREGLEALLLQRAQEIADLTAERDQARCDVTLMATAKIGDRCEHHKIPLAELERLALRECPICWKACAEGLEAQLTARAQEIEQVKAVQKQMMLFATTKPSPQQTRQKSPREMVELFAQELSAALVSRAPQSKE